MQLTNYLFTIPGSQALPVESLLEVLPPATTVAGVGFHDFNPTYAWRQLRIAVEAPKLFVMVR